MARSSNPGEILGHRAGSRDLESDFWRHSGVDLLTAPLAEYVAELTMHIKPEPVAPA
jgi:hypothetical protein